MSRNHIKDRWWQSHWKEWREIRATWNQLRKSWEAPKPQSGGVKLAECERSNGRSPSGVAECDSIAFGSWSGGHSVSRSFPKKPPLTGI